MKIYNLFPLLAGPFANWQPHLERAAALGSVVDLDPTRAEAHWYLALLDRQRGRYDSSEAHLRAFLTYTDPSDERLAAQRASAEKRLRALADEKRLAAARASAVATCAIAIRFLPAWMIDSSVYENSETIVIRSAASRE